MATLSPNASVSRGLYGSSGMDARCHGFLTMTADSYRVALLRIPLRTEDRVMLAPTRLSRMRGIPSTRKP